MLAHPHLTSCLWGAGIVATVALVTLIVGFSLLLRQLDHQRLGLRLVTISGAVLTAAGVVICLILAN